MCPYETHKLAKTGGILFNPPQDPGLMAMMAHRVWHYTLQYSSFMEKVLKDTGTFDIVSSTTQKWGDVQICKHILPLFQHVQGGMCKSVKGGAFV